MNPGDRYTCPNGFGWIVRSTTYRQPGHSGALVLIDRDPANNPNPWDSQQWMGHDTFRSMFDRYRPEGEAIEALVCAMDSGGIDALDDLKARQARRQAEGRL